MRNPSPADVARELLDITARIDRSQSPSMAAVASAIEGVLVSVSRRTVATDRSLAVALRDSLHAAIQALAPGEVTELYDTSEAGKGFKPGYVSFGLQPASWQNEGIIGGILIRGTYNPKEFRSEKKDDSGKDFKHSQGGAVVTISLDAAYYNKRPGGDVVTQGTVIDLGTATVTIEADESVGELELEGSKLSSGVKQMIQEIASNPPDYAQSAARKKKHSAPTGSPASFVSWLLKNNRSEVGKTEVDAIVRAMVERGTAAGTAREQVMDKLRHSRIPVNPNA